MAQNARVDIPLLAEAQPLLSINTTPSSSSPDALLRSSPEVLAPASSKQQPETKSKIEKRKANTLAARRYRQTKLDKMAELESALKAMQDERNSAREQIAKLQGENQVLRDIVGQKAS